MKSFLIFFLGILYLLLVHLLLFPSLTEIHLYLIYNYTFVWTYLLVDMDTPLFLKTWRLIKIKRRRKGARALCLC